MVRAGPASSAPALCFPPPPTQVAFGLGGIHVEVLKDMAFRIAPITGAEADRLVRSATTIFSSLCGNNFARRTSRAASSGTWETRSCVSDHVVRTRRVLVTVRARRCGRRGRLRYSRATAASRRRTERF